MTDQRDIDPQETQEWLDAIAAVIENEGVERAHCAGLLTDVEMKEPADLALRVHLAAAVLEAPDQHHLVEESVE